MKRQGTQNAKSVSSSLTKGTILFALALAGCSAESQTSTPTTDIAKQQKAADDYYFEHRSFVATKLVVDVVLYKNEQDIKANWDKDPSSTPIAKDRMLMAYSNYRVDDDGISHCTMHIVDPAIKYAPEYIGHEFTHCMFGDFHPTQD